MRTGRTRYGDSQTLSVPRCARTARLPVEFTIVPLTDVAGRMAGIAAILRDATRSFEEPSALCKEVAALQVGQAD
jgi:hypothetical protein